MKRILAAVAVVIFFMNGETLKVYAEGDKKIYSAKESADYIVNHAKRKFGVNSYLNADEESLFYYSSYLLMGWLDYQNSKKANPNFRYDEDNEINNRIIKIWQYLGYEGEVALSYSIYKNPEYLKKVSAANAAKDAAELKKLENLRDNSYAELKNLYGKTPMTRAEFLAAMKEETNAWDNLYNKVAPSFKANRSEMLQKIKS